MKSPLDSNSTSDLNMLQKQKGESTTVRNPSLHSSVQSEGFRFGRTWWKTFIRHNIFAVLTVSALLLAVFAGHTLRDSSVLKGYWTPRRVALIRFPGEIFYDAMRLISIPLYMSAIIAAIGSMTLKSVRFVGSKMVIFLILSSLGASTIGTIIVYLVEPATVKDHPAHAICLLPDSDNPNSPPACTSDGHPCLPSGYGQLIYGSTDDLPDTNKSTRFCKEPYSISKCIYPTDLILDIVRILTPPNIVEAFRNVRTTTPNFKRPDNPKDPSYESCTEYIMAEGPKKPITNFRITTSDYTLGENIRGLFAYFLFVGIAALSIQDSGRPFLNFVTSLSECTLRMGIWILWLTPFGLLSLNIAAMLELKTSLADLSTGRRSNNDFDRGPIYVPQTVPTLVTLIVTVLSVLVLYILVLLPLLYFYIVKKSPLKLYRQLIPVAITAFGNNSASGCVPQTIRILEEVCELDARVVRFMIPIACVTCSAGSAITCAGFLMYIAQIHGIQVNTIGTFIRFCFTPSIATALSPYDLDYRDLGYRIEMSLALGTVGLPYEYINYVAAIRVLMRPWASITNVYTQCVGTAIICHLSRSGLEYPEDNFELKDEPKAGGPKRSTAEGKNASPLVSKFQSENNRKSTVPELKKYSETVRKEVKVEVPARALSMEKHSIDENIVTTHKRGTTKSLGHEDSKVNPKYQSESE